MLTAGYNFVRTYRYGEYPFAASFDENTLMEQLLWKHPVGKLGLVNRYRL